MLAAQGKPRRRMAFPLRESSLLRLTHRRPQHGIDEARKSLHPHALGQFYRRIAGRRGRYPVKIEQLIKAKVQDFPHERLDFADRTVDILAQNPVECISGLDSSIDELCHETPVLLTEAGLTKGLGQRHIGIRPVFMYFI